MLNISRGKFLGSRTGKNKSLEESRKKTQKELLILDLKEEPKPRIEKTIMLGLKEVKYVEGGNYEQEKHRLKVSQYQMIMKSANKGDLEDYIFSLAKNNDSMFSIIINPLTNKYELWTIEGEEVERFTDEFWEN